MNITRDQKIDIVKCYQDNDLIDTIDYINELGLITKEQKDELLENCIDYPYEDDYFEYKFEYIIKTFNLVGIDDDLFKELVNNIEKGEL